MVQSAIADLETDQDWEGDMTQFCKIFDSSEYGQILVKIDRHPETGNPEVRFFIQPEKLGVCSISFGFTDDEDGWHSADRNFYNTDLAYAEKIAKQIIESTT